jgi:hypothetical protein
MGMMKCPECGRTISTKADPCPGCGRPNRGLLGRPGCERFANLGCLLVVVAIVAVVAMLGGLK